MTARDLYARAVATFDTVVRAVAADRWTAPTPCAGWDALALARHVVGENRWAAELLSGASIADVGTRLDGDLLGDDPVAAWAAARDAAALAADGVVADAARPDATVALSVGPTPVEEYLRQLGADHLIHAWDLATASGVNLRFDPELAAAVTAWFGPLESQYRSAGMVGPRPPMPANAEPQALLLAMFGRSEALAVVDRFSAAFDAQDVDTVMACMTTDCVFESTRPPDGERHAGVQAVRAAWQRLFAEAGDQRFTTEARFDSGDRVAVQWRYEWPGGHVRGVDLFRVQGGLVAEKLAYVKG